MAKRKATSLKLEAEPRRASKRLSHAGGVQKLSSAAGAISPAPKTQKTGTTTAKKSDEEEEAVNGMDSKEAKVNKATRTSRKKTDPETKASQTENVTSKSRQYWLMKAEPESRLERGHDVKFSIDDLAARTKPEPWDGIRAYAARNNIRSMRRGDLAFFYHSSCKVPAIVGIMEIVEEHSPDLSAHDPDAAYYDPSSSPEEPKWSVVHVEFRQKLQTPITLKELKAWYGEKGHPLEEMQMLRMGRMSVSKVSQLEWTFLVDEMRKRGDDVDL